MQAARRPLTFQGARNVEDGFDGGKRLGECDEVVATLGSWRGNVVETVDWHRWRPDKTLDHRVEDPGMVEWFKAPRFDNPYSERQDGTLNWPLEVDAVKRLGDRSHTLRWLVSIRPLCQLDQLPSLRISTFRPGQVGWSCGSVMSIIRIPKDHKNKPWVYDGA